MHQYSPVEIPEYLTSEHQYKTSIKCFTSDVTEQHIICCCCFFHLVVGGSKRQSHKYPAQKHLQQPKPKMAMVSFPPPLVNCSQLIFCSQLHVLLTCVFSLWPTTWKASRNANKNQSCLRTSFQNEALFTKPFLWQT